MSRQRYEKSLTLHRLRFLFPSVGLVCWAHTGAKTMATPPLGELWRRKARKRGILWLSGRVLTAPNGGTARVFVAEHAGRGGFFLVGGKGHHVFGGETEEGGFGSDIRFHGGKWLYI